MKTEINKKVPSIHKITLARAYSPKFLIFSAVRLGFTTQLLSNIQHEH